MSTQSKCVTTKGHLMPYKAIRRITKGPHLAYKPDAGGRIKRRESKITTVAQAVKAYLHHTTDSAAPLILSDGMHTYPIMGPLYRMHRFLFEFI